MSSPTQRTLAHLRKQGYVAAVVEKWNPHAKIRTDLFGCVDVLAIGPCGTLAVQTTSDSNVAARVRKIAEAEHIGAMRKAGWSIEVHGWRRNKNGRWVCRVVDLS